MPAPKIETRYVDRTDLTEVFTDNVEKFLFDGNTLRLEFSVQRLDAPGVQSKPVGVRVPVARMVLTPQATLDLYNKLSNMVGILQKKGMLQKANEKPKPN